MAAVEQNSSVSANQNPNPAEQTPGTANQTPGTANHAADDFPITLIDPAEAPVLNVPDVVALERAIAEQGTSLATLMERAGTSVVNFITQRWKSHCRIVILCGTGNNGGDGWVIGRQLALAGYRVKLITLCPADAITAHPAAEAATRTVLDIAECSRTEVFVAHDASEVGRWMAEADVVVDALLGTGFAYDSVRQPAAGYIEELRTIVDARNCCMGSTPPYIIAVDVPSGLNAQTGAPATPCVQADCTITMIVGKPGVVDPANAKYVGALHVARIADIDGLVGA